MRISARKPLVEPCRLEALEARTHLAAAAPLVAREPDFSVAGGAYVGPITLSLTSTPGAEIRYTLDGSMPGATSPLYAAPITLAQGRTVRARAFGDGMITSDVASESYVVVSPNVADFSSNLPIVVVDAMGTAPDRNDFSGALLAVMDVGPDGRARLTENLDHIGPSSLRVRGMTATFFEKKQYFVETQDYAGEDTRVGLLDLPPESDWVLYAPYLDKSLMRDHLAFAWANEMGRYAPRTRFVELFWNAGTGAASSLEYRGVYVIEERIKRDEDRVAVARLDGDDDATPPDVTGGYIIKKDHEPDVTTARGTEIEFHDPDTLTAAQQAYITGYLNEFETALYSTNFADPVNGYAKYIDVDSFVDFHILTEMTRNVDTNWASTYFHKDRGGKLVAGPAWDFDNSLGRATANAGNLTTGWHYPRLAMYLGWMNRLVQDPEFTLKVADRWYALREDVFTDTKLLADIEATQATLDEAANRNFQRWDLLDKFLGLSDTYWQNPTKSYDYEVELVKDWLVEGIAGQVGRVRWIDAQFVKPPTFSSDGGHVAAAAAVTMSGGGAPGTVYYTTDGSDPRRPGGAIAPGATAYAAAAPPVVNSAVQFKARLYNNGVWSAMNEASFSIVEPAAAGDVVVGEVNFNPAAPSARELAVNPTLDNDDFEFLELWNVSEHAIDLLDARFARGITFKFDNAPLAVGERGVIVRDPAAFAVRYGSGVRILGTYAGTLSNAGERLTLVTAGGATAVDFKYNDKDPWHSRSDGNGSSLELADVGGDANEPSSWRSSYEYNGTPGSAGAGPQDRVVINEVLANTDLLAPDFIELKNTTDEPIDVSGWYLSDSNDDYAKFRIPDGTTIPAGGHVAFDETQFGAPLQGAKRFALNGARGDDVWLTVADPATGVILAFADSAHFDATALGESLGRTPDGAGPLYPMSAVTKSGANGTPRIGPVVVSEVMYNSAEGDADLEYVEILNIGDAPVDLTGWRFNRGIDFWFAPGTTIGPRQALLITRFDPSLPGNGERVARFRDAYGIGASVPIVGGHTDVLDNAGETLRLVRPDAPTAAEPTVVPYVMIEDVKFGIAAPWPTILDGSGRTLGRLGITEFGNAPGNWSAQAPSPGSVPFGHALFTGGLEYELDGPLTFDSLTVRDGAILVLRMLAGKALRTGGLSIESGGRLDVGDGDLIVDAAPADRQALLDALSASILAGRNGGTWDGRGLTSSAAAANRFTGFALVANDDGSGVPLLSEFGGHAVDQNAILVMHTYNGDANLDGRINGDDYFRIDRGFLAQPDNPVYRDGDFNYDGRINADDYFLIDQAFLGQGTPLGGSGVSMTLSSSAEPPAAVVADAESRRRKTTRHRPAHQGVFETPAKRTTVRRNR